MEYQYTTAESGRVDFNLSGRASDEYEYCIVGPGHPRRAEIERFIGERFAAVHGAHINCFMPQLIALYDPNGVVQSAIGIRKASNTHLFLEHYLDVPVEQAITDQAENHPRHTSRKQIVEVGNLASLDLYASRRLFEFLALHLIQGGFRWVVFTGCNTLQQVFKRMRIELISLGDADQNRLPRNLGSWGHYYDDSPQVMAGSLSQCFALARKARNRMPGLRA